MCQIIVYGFTVDGNLVSGPTCNTDTLSTIGTDVSISVETVDVGISMIANVNVLINGINKGTFISPAYTPSSTGLWTFHIPFTGLPTTAGTYTFGSGGCAYINSPDFTSQYCYACTSLRCTSLTVTQACTVPSCGFNLL